MSKFQFGKTKVQKTAESIREDNEQGGAPLIPVTPDTHQQQEEPAKEQEKEHEKEQVKEQNPEESQPQVDDHKPKVQEEQSKEENPEEENLEAQAEQVNEEKPEAPAQQKDEPQQTPENSDSADTPPVPNKALAAIRDKSATNGIVVNVPMEDYFQLMMLKKIEKKTLKELALQAIHEFVERNRVM